MVLEDYIKISRIKHGAAFFSHEQMDDCFARAKTLQLHEQLVIGELTVTPYYAGHVLGAVMFFLECRGRSVMYTGDFTMVPDHHLSAARVPSGLRPDVLITETTYSTTIRSSKRAREMELCRKIQECLDGGGKVLVPVFTVGRSQEICLLCEKHWARNGLKYPMYCAKGMVEKALAFFRIFSNWASVALRHAEKPFELPHLRAYEG